VTIQRQARSGGTVAPSTSFNVTRLSNGDVILYNTNEYKLILVKNQNVRLLPDKFADLWESALKLTEKKPPEAVLFDDNELQEIAASLASIILLVGRKWPLPRPRKQPKPKAHA
jgi:hypothetical protein